MHESPDIREDEGATWDAVASVGVLLRVCVWQAHGSDLVPAVGFFDEGFDVREVGEVLGGGEARGVPEEGGEFGLGGGLDAGVEGYREEEGAEG